MDSIFRVFVGTYSQPILFGTGEILQGKGTGIHIYSFNSRTGEMWENSAVPAANPSFLALSSDGRSLYAVNELKEFQGKTGGAVSAYSVSENNGLSLINQKCTGGTDPCFVSVDRAGRRLVVANYMSGSVCCYPLASDGSLEDRGQFIQHEGCGTHTTRQLGPHAHGAVETPDERYVVVPDLGIDRLMIYPEDFENRCLKANGVRTFSVGEGMGPRSCVFNKNGDRCYLFCELSLKILTLTYKDGSFKLLQTISSLLERCDGDCSGGDIHLSPDNKFLYASNRGQNSIVAFSVQDDGTLQHIQTLDCGGKTPRNFSLDPTGRWLLVGNQDSDNIAIFARDDASGKLTLRSVIDAPTPVCICVDTHHVG